MNRFFPVVNSEFIVHIIDMGFDSTHFYKADSCNFFIGFAFTYEF